MALEATWYRYPPRPFDGVSDIKDETMIHRFLIHLLAWVSFLACIQQQGFAQTASTSPAQAVSPGSIQTSFSRVYTFVDKKGFGHQHGIEGKLLPSLLALGAAQNAGQLIFDMTSFDADGQNARKYVGLTGTTDDGTRAAVNDNMKGELVLHVARYPTATFDVSSAQATGQSNSNGIPFYRLDGQFTLHGVTRPLSILAEVSQARGWLHVRGRFEILQSDYNIKPFTKAFGAVGVADRLVIFGDLYVAPTSAISMQAIPSRL